MAQVLITPSEAERLPPIPEKLTEQQASNLLSAWKHLLAQGYTAFDVTGAQLDSQQAWMFTKKETLNPFDVFGFLADHGVALTPLTAVFTLPEPQPLPTFASLPAENLAEEAEEAEEDDATSLLGDSVLLFLRRLNFPDEKPMPLNESGMLGRSRTDKEVKYFLDRNTAISRKHFFIEVDDDGEVFIEDLGSSNGTALNGVRLQPHVKTRLRLGDLLSFAGERFEVQG